MSESFSEDHRQGADRPLDRVDGLDAQALTAVASRARQPAGADDVCYVDELVQAALAADRTAVTQIASQMIAVGMRAEEIADHYVPEAARKLGEMWSDDRLGFVAVTVGSARLQSLLRELGPEWRADLVTLPTGPSLLVLVASDISHTLGATVLTGQLRRLGMSVCLMVGARPEDLGPVLRQRQFDAVMVSASLGESLGTLRRQVDAIRMAIALPPPIVLGGTIVTTEGLTSQEILARTGVDVVTNDLNEALALCGLAVPERAGRRDAARRGLTA